MRILLGFLYVLALRAENFIAARARQGYGQPGRPKPPEGGPPLMYMYTTNTNYHYTK
jgi:hypothetical protein